MQLRLRSLDGLRGLAAAVVVAHHLLMVSSPRLSTVYYGHPLKGRTEWMFMWSPLRVLWDGPMAVWVFFVLSGYVLSRRPFAGEPIEARSYYWRRTCRLYIPMFGSLALALAVRAVPHARVEDASWWLNSHATSPAAGEVGKAALMIFGNETTLNSVWWSLQWEVWFSLALPLLLLLLRPVRRHMWLFGLACLFTASWYSIHLSPFQPTLLSRAVGFMPMFGVGMTLAAYEPAIRSARWLRKAWVGWAAAAFFVLLYWGHFWIPRLLSSHLDFEVVSGLNRGTGILAAAGLVVVALASDGIARALSCRPLDWLGVRSYSLYLVHEPIIVSLGFAFHVRSPSILFIVAALLLTLVVTEAFYRWVEVPSLKVGRLVLRRSPALT